MMTSRCRVLVAFLFLLTLPLGAHGHDVSGRNGDRALEARPVQGVAPGTARGGSVEIIGFEVLAPRALNPSTITCDDGIWLFGHISGKATGTTVFTEDDHRMTFYSDTRFAAGERLTLFVSNRVEYRDGTPATGAGSFDFVNSVAASTGAFTLIQTETTNIGAESSRPYGGSTADLDEDGSADLAVVNEDTSDVRVLLNSGTCNGMLDPVAPTTYPTGAVGSPSETADFNRDGHIDLCVANVGGNSVSILLGNGDGTFGPHQEIPSGTEPHGITVLDADLDGDQDVAVANYGSDDVAVILNAGNGVFGPATQFDGGMGGEWAIGSADMNLDGIRDLIVASLSATRISVLTGNGDGTFTLSWAGESGGTVWMLVTGDVNQDGVPDVATANRFYNSGSILLGTGNADGALSAPVAYAAGVNPIATDLGDLDGDGDLDWVTSNFFGPYHVHLNQGDGTFVLATTLPQPSNGSCSLLVDLDDDRDLDIVTVDEIADVIEIWRNNGIAEDCDGNQAADACDLAAGVLEDCNGNFVADACDIAAGDSNDANLDGIPDECQTDIAICGAGAVDAACGDTADVLFVNALDGSGTREVSISRDESLSIAVNEPPVRHCDGATTACCIYVWVGTPGAGDVVALPKDLGTMCYGPLISTTKAPKRIWNSLGFNAKLGVDDGPGNPPVIQDGGSFEIFHRPGGLGRSVVVTLQGVIEDSCSQATVPLSVTNGLTLRIQ